MKLKKLRRIGCRIFNDPKVVCSLPLSVRILDHWREEFKRSGADLPPGDRKTLQFPIPVETCLELYKRLHSEGMRFKPSHDPTWPIPRGYPSFSGCYSYVGPRKGVTRSVLRTSYQFASGPVLTPTGRILIANTGDDLNLTRIYPLEWNPDRGDVDWMGMELVPRLETRPVLFAIGKERLFSFSPEGAQEAWGRNSEVQPDPISATAWASFPVSGGSSTVLLLRQHLRMLAVREISKRSDSGEARFDYFIGGQLCPWGVILPAGHDPRIWKAFFLIDAMRETKHQASLFTMVIEYNPNGTAIARTAAETVTQEVLPNMPVYGDLGKVFIVCPPESKADSVMLWYSDIPPILFLDGRVAVVHWPELIVFSRGQDDKYGSQSMFLLPSVDPPSAMIADREGFIYLTIGSNLLALDANQHITWTVGFDEPIIGEPVLVAPGIILVATGSQLLVVE